MWLREFFFCYLLKKHGPPMPIRGHYGYYIVCPYCGSVLRAVGKDGNGKGKRPRGSRVR